MLKLYSSGNAKKAAIVAVAIIALGAAFYFSNNVSQNDRPKSLSQEEIMAKQMKELEKLRQENAKNPLTKEEINKQMKELEKLRNNNIL